MLYTRNTIEHRDGTLAAIVPAAVGLIAVSTNSGIAESVSPPSARSMTSLRTRFPRAILLRGIRASPACISTATWQTAYRDRYRAPMRARA